MYELLQRFQMAKWPSTLLKIIVNYTIRYAIYDFLFVFYCNHVSILHRFRDIITYFAKFKDNTWPWSRPLKGQFVIPVLKYRMANQCTKFQVYSLSRSGDILGGNKSLNGSRDHLWRFVVDVLGLVTIQQCIKFHISTFTHYEGMKVDENAEIGVVLGLGVTQGQQQHSHLVEHIWLPIRL